MRFRTLGRTDIEVSVVCCGAMAMSGAGIFGEQADDLSVQTVHAALDAGITFFDTAEAYGRGHSEEVLGRALEGRREEVVVASKAAPNHLREADLVAACESSLRRLGMEHMDLYQVHWPNHGLPFDETASVLDRLVEQGKIRCWGVSNFGPHDLTDALACGRPQVDQLPYSLLWRATEHEIVPVCVQNDVSVLCYSPMAQGILTGKFASAEDVPAQRKRARYCWDNAIGLSFAVVEELRVVAGDLGEPMADVALAWLLARPGVTSVIAGMRTPEQSRQNARAADLSLGPDIVERLERASQPLTDALDSDPDMWQTGDESRYR
jgi:myo-inositol catabolism protein IolS